MPAAVSKKELASLLSLLTDEALPIDSVAALFQRTFAKSDHFRVANALCLLVQDRAIGMAQRFFALYILFDLYRSEAPGTNPFLPVFIEEMNKDLEPCERNFVLHLLCYPPKGLAKKSPKELIAEHDDSIPPPEPDVAALEKDFLEKIG
eukprot:CAMPEP_0206220246 /NCGR_PEP_ID=MMETSP0047_2-20121206/4777_1 /ASSEMBLY_ACC=CAM_ASM_000192 /TAXON_ID=195065 /ORGANISM="Chroomonas mesostigmatica_cf, Strain CCMP1168" /LENGTH=148 /DNA_ID=CAMNT_0053642897 /DNA_START=14 /DNA_END=456 /DNA_ORIENTATION=+